MQAPVIYSVCIETSHRAAEQIEALLPEDDAQTTAWYSADQDYARIESFFDRKADAEQRLVELRSLLAGRTFGEACTATVRDVRRENWAESWRQHFHALRASDRIWIKPSWEAAPAAGGVVVEMDPGMSFGTGQHATTQGCLQLLDRLGAGVRGKSLLDLGCGSGILAIAAAKLGFGRVLAVDNDPEAVRIAGENCARNGVAQQVACATADITAMTTRRRFDVVAANLLADLLVEHARAIAKTLTVKRSGRLIVSGILTPQYPSVRAAFATLGLREETVVEIGEWISACLTRN